MIQRIQRIDVLSEGWPRLSLPHTPGVRMTAVTTNSLRYALIEFIDFPAFPLFKALRAEPALRPHGPRASQKRGDHFPAETVLGEGPPLDSHPVFCRRTRVCSDSFGLTRRSAGFSCFTENKQQRTHTLCLQPI